MTRPILLSNNRMHVGLNLYGLVHDFYFPRVGLENHAAAKHLRHLVGVWVDGQLRWLDDGTWDISTNYYGDVLVSRIIATNKDLSVRLEFDDFVDSEFNAFLRNIHVINMTSNPRHIRLFMHQVFDISDSHTPDTAQYLPDQPMLVHYKGRRTFLINGQHADSQDPFDSFSVGLFGIEGHEGTYRDAEDGELMQNRVEHGSVDSVLAFHLDIDAHSSRRVHYWIAAGESEHEARKVNSAITETGLLHHLLKTANYWSEWTKPARLIAARLPAEHQSPFVRSALLIKAQTDAGGAVIASTDTAMMNYSRDAYAYCWPRDGAYALWPLLRLGYTEELLAFFSFVARGLHDDGYLSHKYRADGSLGASWHPYTELDGFVMPPIQTDETATVLFLVGQYYRLHNEPLVLADYYDSLVSPMANFLSGYTADDGLPRPSYDLWEEKALTSTYTTAVTYASLIEAAYLADAIGNTEDAVRWRTTADKMYAMRDTFYDEEAGFFCKGFTEKDGEKSFDKTIDSSSLFGVFMFGYFDIKDPRVTRAYETLQASLSDGIRVIRYTDDAYRRIDGEPSNPWPVTSLWFAQYALELGDTEQATKILSWVRSVMSPSGVIAEQYDKNDEPLSVSPLTWSQAEYMNALLDMTIDEEPAA